MIGYLSRQSTDYLTIIINEDLSLSQKKDTMVENKQEITGKTIEIKETIQEDKMLSIEPDGRNEQLNYPLSLNNPELNSHLSYECSEEENLEEIFDLDKAKRRYSTKKDKEL